MDHHSVADADHCRMRRDRQVISLDEFTEADIQAIRNAEPPPEAGAFDAEVLK